MSLTRTFTFEIGSEEIPAFDLQDATAQLKSFVPDLFNNRGISYGNVSIFTSPRRQIVMVEDVQEKTEEVVEMHKGPSIQIAYDENGNPTQALIGFARSKGVSIEDLERINEGGKECVCVTTTTPQKDVKDMLGDVCLEIINKIKWPKSMNWGSTREVYSRPIRWLFAMFGNEVVNFSYANLNSGNETCGHRFLSPGPHLVKSADDLIDILKNNYVFPTFDERKDSILKDIKKIEEETSLTSKIPEKTFVEVVNLCEYPTPMLGKFDEKFLEVPEEIIVDAMLMHQRYFPLYQKNGKLANKFIITSNGNPQYEDIIVEGNERVVAARLYDAKFFWEEDLQTPLEQNVEKLKNVIYQEKLGTIFDKNERNVKIASFVAGCLDITDDQKRDIERAVYLMKADLPSQAVIEFTSVQGIMGSYYAKASGENDAVALAIKEHYCPKFSGDVVPSETVGKVVALADKLDTVCALIAVGERPTGSKDPFGVRRAALGVIAIMESNIDFDLLPAIDKSLQALESQGVKFDFGEAKNSIVEFFIERSAKISKDRGCSQQDVDAVLATDTYEPIVIISRACKLCEARKQQSDVFDDLSSAYIRAFALCDMSLGYKIDESLLNDREKLLVEKINDVKKQVEELVSNDFSQALHVLSTLRNPIDDFFDNTMIMDSNEAIKNNRIRILNNFISVFKNVADFSKFSK